MRLIDKDEDLKRLSIVQIVSARTLTFGAMRSMLTLTDGLKAHGHSVNFLAFQGRGGADELRARGETVVEVKVRAKVDPIAIYEMGQVIRKFKADVVHTHLSTSSLNGTLAARFAKIPAISTVHGMSGKLSFIFANHLIAVSEEVKSHLMGQGVRADKITVIYNGIEFQSSNSANIEKWRDSIGLNDRFPIIGTVARITRLKGVQDGIRAICELKGAYPKIAYLVIGSGEDEPNCRNLVNSLDLKESVYFLGYQPDTCDLLNLMDVFLFPSLKEAMGMALAEASLQGVPSVSTTAGGIPEVILPGWGTLADPGDWKAMAKLIRDLIENPERHAQLSMQVREYAESKFSVQQMVTRVEEVYKSAIARSG